MIMMMMIGLYLFMDDTDYICILSPKCRHCLSEIVLLVGYGSVYLVVLLCGVVIVVTLVWCVVLRGECSICELFEWGRNVHCFLI